MITFLYMLYLLYKKEKSNFASIAKTNNFTMIRFYIFILSLLVMDLPIAAQQEDTRQLRNELCSDSIIQMPQLTTLNIPTLTSMGTMPTLRWYPFMWSGWNSWDVHQGLNAQIGASIFSTFGSGNTYSGAGFTQNIAILYAKPLTDKLSLAVGGYLNSMQWWHNDYHDAGLTAVLGYRYDEHWSSYIYGQKSLMPDSYMPYPLMNMSELGDRIGAAVRYDFNPNFSVQVSFEYGKSKPWGWWREEDRR